MTVEPARSSPLEEGRSEGERTCRESGYLERLEGEAQDA